jgi:hypothetical protein
MTSPKPVTYLAPLTPGIVAALKALSQGVANEGQQLAALEWWLFEASDMRAISHEGERTHDTAFREGRRFVGLVTAGAIQAKPAKSSRTTRQQPIREAKSDDQPK